jgi:glycosyltransferase involved in cell wall biosynthesis
MSKTLLAVNTLTSVASQAYASHINLAFRMGKDCPEDEFLLFNGYRTSIDRFRNMAAKLALQNECDYLLFLDDDILVEPDTYRRLKSWDVDVVTPVVYIRSYPFKPMFFKSIIGEDQKVAGLTTYDDFEEVSKIFPAGLLPVAAIGFSCCLIKCELLKRVPPAWFVTGTGHTEDVYFCIKARQHLENALGIYVDTTLHAGHMLDPEFVSQDTVEALRHFYEELSPELKNERDGDHSANYLEKQKAALTKIGYLDAELEAKNAEVRASLK